MWVQIIILSSCMNTDPDTDPVPVSVYSYGKKVILTKEIGEILKIIIKNKLANHSTNQQQSQ